MCVNLQYMLKKTHCFLEKIKQKFSTTAGRDKFQFCPYECGPCNCKSNVPMFRKIDRKKVKTMCHSQKSNAYICSNAEFAPFFARFKEFTRSPLEAGSLPTGSMTPLVMTAGLSTSKMVSIKTTKMVSNNFIIFCLVKIACS